MAAIPLPDPPLGDGVVALRPWQPEHAPVLAAAWAMADLQRWTAVPDRRDEAAARRWIETTPSLRDGGRSLDLLVVAADDERPLGEVGLAGFGRGGGRDAQVGWWVLEGERGSGVAARATDLLVTWALGPPLHLDVVLAEVDEANVASHHVARAAGFRRAHADPTRWSRSRGQVRGDRRDRW